MKVFENQHQRNNNSLVTSKSAMKTQPKHQRKQTNSLYSELQFSQAQPGTLRKAGSMADFVKSRNAKTRYEGVSNSNTMDYQKNKNMKSGSLLFENSFGCQIHGRFGRQSDSKGAQEPQDMGAEVRAFSPLV